MKDAVVVSRGFILADFVRKLQHREEAERVLAEFYFSRFCKETIAFAQCQSREIAVLFQPIL